MDVAVYAVVVASGSLHGTDHGYSRYGLTKPQEFMELDWKDIAKNLTKKGYAAIVITRVKKTLFGSPTAADVRLLIEELGQYNIYDELDGAKDEPADNENQPNMLYIRDGVFPERILMRDKAITNGRLQAMQRREQPDLFGGFKPVTNSAKIPSRPGMC